jgi:hypothetical protein
MDQLIDEQGCDRTNADPDIWPFVNELRQFNLAEVREVLANLRHKDPECYKTLVKTFRELRH